MEKVEEKRWEMAGVEVGEGGLGELEGMGREEEEECQVCRSGGVSNGMSSY